MHIWPLLLLGLSHMTPGGVGVACCCLLGRCWDPLGPGVGGSCCCRQPQLLLLLELLQGSTGSGQERCECCVGVLWWQAPYGSWTLAASW
jgi:hypothetical protein